MRADTPDQMVINLAGYARNGYMISQFRVRVMEMTATLTSHAPWLIASHPVSEGLIIRTHPVPRSTAEADRDIAERTERRQPTRTDDVVIATAHANADAIADGVATPDNAPLIANAYADDILMTTVTTGTDAADDASPSRALGDSA